MIKVVIFDLDGLLIDSQPLQYEAYNQVFTKYGFPLTHENWWDWVHGSINQKTWIQKNNLPLAPEKIRAEKKQIYNKLIIEKLRLKPGAQNLVNRLFGKFRLCIASSSRIESIMLVLEKFNLKSQFEMVTSDTEMIKGKPHPDIFLKTIEIMNVKSMESIVIEDSIVGLKAAQSAGIKCIICPDSFVQIDRSAYSQADKIVNDLNEITIDMIEKLSPTLAF